MVKKIQDKDRFVMQSESGEQWYVCSLIEHSIKKQNTPAFEYEIIKIFYSEDKALKELAIMNMFNKDIRKLKTVKKAKDKKEAQRQNRKNLKELIG